MGHKFELGQKVKCIVSGFEGITTSRVEYLNGCIQYLVKPKVHEEKYREGVYMDEQQLMFVDDGVTKELEEISTIRQPLVGGDMPPPH